MLAEAFPLVIEGRHRPCISEENLDYAVVTNNLQISVA